MKVLVGTHGYPSKEYPMQAIHEMVYAKALKKMGIDVAIGGMDMRSFRRKRKFGLEKLNIEGIPVFVMNTPVGAVDSRILGATTALALRRLLPTIYSEWGEPDIIHSHFSDTSYAYTKVMNKKYPIVITEHSSLLNKERKEDISKGLYKISKYAFDHCDKLTVGSPHYKERIDRNFDIQSKYIPILTPTDIFHRGQKNNPYFKIVSTGNLKEQKGHRDLIEAFDLSMREENAKLFIFGEGPDRDFLERMIKERNLEDKVFLKGQTDTLKIAEEYESADLFVLASYTETFGKAIIEAMKAGLPVISTKNGGSDGFIKEFNGKLVPVGDIERIASAMKEIKNNIHQYNGNKISQYIEENYSENKIIEEVIRVYDDLLGVHHGR